MVSRPTSPLAKIRPVWASRLKVGLAVCTRTGSSDHLLLLGSALVDGPSDPRTNLQHAIRLMHCARACGVRFTRLESAKPLK